MELCMDINEDTFKQAQHKKDSKQKRKIQGSGQFMLTQNDKAKENSKRVYESTQSHVDLKHALKPKVF